MRRNWIRKLIGGLSFCSALFIFQACYGTPQDLKDDMVITGVVKSKTTGLPVKGIKVSVADGAISQITGAEGQYGLITMISDATRITFEDADLAADGAYLRKDTLITGPKAHVLLNVLLDPK